MSTKGSLNRERAVAEAGVEAVEAVERVSCDFTNRVQCDGDTRIEFAASVRCEAGTLIAYYYQEAAAVEVVGSLDQLDWEIEGYEIV